MTITLTPTEAMAYIASHVIATTGETWLRFTDGSTLEYRVQLGGGYGGGENGCYCEAEIEWTLKGTP